MIFEIIGFTILGNALDLGGDPKQNNKKDEPHVRTKPKFGTDENGNPIQLPTPKSKARYNDQ